METNNKTSGACMHGWMDDAAAAADFINQPRQGGYVQKIDVCLFNKVSITVAEPTSHQ